MLQLLLILLSLVSLVAPAPDGFVYRSGTKFILNGKKHFVVSANYWQAMNLGVADAKKGGNRARLIADLDAMKRQGINNLRIMVASEGPDNSPFRMSPTLMPSPGVYDVDILEGLDFAMAEMAKRGFKVVMCLNNAWHWSGGFAAYVKWVTGEPIPYPPSFDKEKNDWTPGGGPEWDKFIQYASRFYNDPAVKDKAQKLFRDHIAMLINRVNKFTGKEYKSDGAIFSWQLANEPQRPPAWWVDETAKYIKSLDPVHMVSTGSEAKEDEADFIRSHSSNAIDYATIHVWAQNRGVYDMMDSSERNIANTVSWGLSHLVKVNKWATRMNKPLILEEFGLARDNWVSKGNKATLYSPKNPIKNRDRYFSAMFMEAAKLHKAGGAFCGFGFWAYAGKARPRNRWISDPPHEPPGWYAVYDKDVSTFKVMQAAYKFAVGN
jgi:mannan endo-1,4-beta-mannosidase